MTELYWITRLDAINSVFVLAMIFALCVATCYGIHGATQWADDDDVKAANRTLRRAKYALAIAAFCAITRAFIPTSKDMMMIYGVGGTIDYIKSNDTAKQLPDKVVSALDKYLDSLNEEDEK
jgi:low temperature requirement protein LtrA